MLSLIDYRLHNFVKVHIKKKNNKQIGSYFVFLYYLSLSLIDSNTIPNTANTSCISYF